MVKVLVSACEKENLVNAIMALDEVVRAQFMEIAVGDVKYYSNDTLPKADLGELGAYIIDLASINGEDLVSIDSTRVRNMCTSVEIYYHYNYYKHYFKTVEDALKYTNKEEGYESIDYRNYSSRTYSVGADKVEVNEAYVDINIDKYLSMCK